jgi:hypothetical protein
MHKTAQYNSTPSAFAKHVLSRLTTQSTLACHWALLMMMLRLLQALLSAQPP